MLIYRGLMLLLASPFALAALAEVVSDYRHADWVEVRGEIVDYEEVGLFFGPGHDRAARPSSPGPGTGSRYNVTVRYQVDGRSHRHQRANLWELPRETRVSIYHNPDDPNRATLSDPRTYSSSGVAIAAALFLVLAFLPHGLVDRLTAPLLGERPDREAQ